MGLESGNYISDLNVSNPVSGDPVSQGDDHLRLIKDVLKKSFPGFSSSIIVTGTDSGSADAYAISPSTAVPGYVALMTVLLKPANTNTGASTINLSSLGTKSIKRPDGAALVAGDLTAGRMYILVYDGTNFIMADGIPSRLNQFALFRNYQTDGTNGGQAPSNTANSWVKAPLNNEAYNSITGATLTSSVISLPAGTYRCSCGIHGSIGQFPAVRLQNTTDAVQIAQTDEPSGGGQQLNEYIFTITGTKNIELQFRIGGGGLTLASDNFGQATPDTGFSEAYYHVSFERLY